ncbi:MAG: hypothetical protein H7Z72_00995 [Bacteroidetes bacterium]|nr:hypothetical protein [Fibrella sp.]
MRVPILIVCLLTFGPLMARGQSASEVRRVATNQRVFPKANHPAEFPGGSDELGKYLSRHLRYPASLLKSGIYPPTVMVSFTVEETGAVENVEVIKLRQEDYTRLEPYLAKIVNVLEKMPRWKPATNGNTAVASRHIIPVSIDVK